MPCQACEHIYRSRSTDVFVPLDGKRSDGFYECPCGQVWFQYDLVSHYWTTINAKQVEILQRKTNAQEKKPINRVRTY